MRLQERRTRFAPFQGLSIVIPMWNEEENIRPTVEAALEECQGLLADGAVRDYEIIIVDDASSDATGRIADALAREHAAVRALHHPRNRKLGGCLKTGFAAARGEVVLYTDADLPCDFAEMRRGLRLLRLYDADVMSAYRNGRTAEGALRAVYSFVYNWLIRVLFGLRVRDVNFAFKLFRRRVLSHMRLGSEGSFIGAEFLIRANRLGFRIVQHGVDYVPRMRGVSTLAHPRVILRMLRELVWLFGELRRVQPLPPVRAGLAEEAPARQAQSS